jgi:hypothetical protein
MGIQTEREEVLLDLVKQQLAIIKNLIGSKPVKCLDEVIAYSETVIKDLETENVHILLTDDDLGLYAIKKENETIEAGFHSHSEAETYAKSKGYTVITKTIEGMNQSHEKLIVGSEVTILEDQCGHGFKIGEKVNIIEIVNECDGILFKCKNASGNVAFVDQSEMYTWTRNL